MKQNQTETNEALGGHYCCSVPALIDGYCIGNALLTHSV